MTGKEHLDENDEREEKDLSRPGKDDDMERSQGHIDPDVLRSEVENMPPEEQAAIISATRFSGPIPPAQELEAYEKVVEGSADRIISMAEEEAIHRRKMEERVLESSSGDSRLGLWLGFIIGITALLVSGAIAVFGNIAAGSLLIFSSIASLVGVFVYGHKQKSPAKNRQSKVKHQQDNQQ